jgi:hypothetical protein
VCPFSNARSKLNQARAALLKTALNSAPLVSASGEINSICILHLSGLCMYHTGRLSKPFIHNDVHLLRALGIQLRNAVWPHMLPECTGGTHVRHFMCNLYGCVHLMRLVRKLSQCYGPRDKRLHLKSGKFQTLLECKSLCCADLQACTYENTCFFNLNSHVYYGFSCQICV